MKFSSHICLLLLLFPLWTVAAAPGTSGSDDGSDKKLVQLFGLMLGANVSRDSNVNRCDTQMMMPFKTVQRV